MYKVHSSIAFAHTQELAKPLTKEEVDRAELKRARRRTEPAPIAVCDLVRGNVAEVELWDDETCIGFRVR